MTELAHKLSLLKGKRTSAEIIKGAKISRETFAKIQRGHTVKLSTLKSIADFLGASRQQWLELVIAWINEEIGEDAKYLQIFPLDLPRSGVSDDAKKLIELLEPFSSSDRHQIVICLHKIISVFSPRKSSSRLKRKIA